MHLFWCLDLKHPCHCRKHPLAHVGPIFHFRWEGLLFYKQHLLPVFFCVFEYWFEKRWISYTFFLFVLFNTNKGLITKFVGGGLQDGGGGGQVKFYPYNVVAMVKGGQQVLGCFLHGSLKFQPYIY